MARHTGNAPTASLKVACVQIRASTGCVRAPLDTGTSTQMQRHEPSRKTLAAFACVTPASLLTLQPPDNFVIDAMDHASDVCRWAWRCRSRRWCRNRRMGWDRDRASWTQRLASRSPGPMSALARIADSSRTSRHVRFVPILLQNSSGSLSTNFPDRWCGDQTIM